MTEHVDPFDQTTEAAMHESLRADEDEHEITHEVVDVSEEKELPSLMRASDLLPKQEPIEDDGSEPAPTPEEATMQSLPLAEREARKLAAMTPEQRARYDAASAEILGHPSVAAFQAEEDRIRASKEATSKAFIEAYRKKKETK